MSSAPSLGVPELAGLASYGDAAVIGYPVDENVRRLVRYQWIERWLMRDLLSHLTAEPVWEVKCGYALHQWQDGLHADGIRRRITEMRHPAPPLDKCPDPALERALDEALRSENAIELLAVSYGVVREALAAAYREHLARSNPLVDQPTRRVLMAALLDHEQALGWSKAAVVALIAHDPGSSAGADAWRAQVRQYLDAAGGVVGPAPATAGLLPPTRATSSFAPDLKPQRDARFLGQYEFDFPPHVIYNDPRVPADERNVALLAKRTLEMDVPEMMASILIERSDAPWEFQLDYSRQLWDEMRHAMMGTVAFEARGVDWSKIPLNVGFSLRLNLHATALERQTILFAIEQSLMPGETGKRFEYRTAVEAGDALSAHFHDYDWADEVLHAQIGRRWLRHEGLDPDAAIAQGEQVHEKTWPLLDQYRESAREDWWNGFVQRVLGRPSALKPEARGNLTIIAE